MNRFEVLKAAQRIQPAVVAILALLVAAIVFFNVHTQPPPTCVPGSSARLLELRAAKVTKLKCVEINKWVPDRNSRQ